VSIGRALRSLSRNAGSATRAWDRYQAFAHSGPIREPATESAPAL
jgi:hypothetical protein